ncbi:DUF3710 domain-containing protein [Leucobacter chinensis]|uniref:DUF3710 domain-containing protein n=1 Tax=Leucobacter chinensis TaxID=2851010 RepID=UPI001C22A63B|nr:DUF3710 domain-containing protein [Leucobacter chinensis]
MTEQGSEVNEPEVEAQEVEEELDTTKSAPADRAENGPFDILEVPAMRPYVDLGSIKVPPREGLQMRLDVDEQAKRIVAVSLDFEGSTLQVQAFSAPKSTGLWHEVRRQVGALLTKQKAQFTEREGFLGQEIVTSVRVPEERGGGVTPVRFIGVDGPRWLLRGSITGKAAADPEAAAQVEQLFRELVVVRGDLPMPPNELLPMKVPAGVQGKS